MAKLAPKRLTVRTRAGAYPVVIGVGLEKELVRAVAREGVRRVAIIADTTTRKLWAGRIARSLRRAGTSVDVVSFPAGERNKDQGTVTRLQDALLKKRFGRDTLIIALGGGVVGDVAGFVAATYMRGVPYIQMPTTLLAMVDSSVGGKVGVDTRYGKNTVGAFYQPRAVIADLSFLARLSKEQVVNGLVEAVKMFMTSDKSALSLVAKLDVRRSLKGPKLLRDIVYRAVRIKARAVMVDEEEKNERRVLNFGHTIGHAVELLSGYRMPHGYAVGHGILVETKVSELLGLLSGKERAAVAAHLARLGIMPSVLRKYPISKVLRATRGDKKVRKGVPHYVLLKALGAVYAKGGQYAHPVPDDVVRKAYASLL